MSYYYDGPPPRPKISPAGQRAMQGIPPGENPPDSAPLTCEEVEEMLDLMATAVVYEGVEEGSLREQYPEVMAHLDSCPNCRKLFDWLVDILRAEEAGELPEIPGDKLPKPDLSFLKEEGG